MDKIIQKNELLRTSNFRVDDIKVSTAEWTEIRHLLENFADRDVSDYFVDNKITKSEIYSILDKNGDRDITYTDFKNVSEYVFRRLHFLLRGYGLRIFSKMPDVDLLAYSDDVPSFLWSCREFVLAALHECAYNFMFVDERFKKDKKIVLSVVKDAGWVLHLVDDSFKKDKEVVLAAVMNEPDALRYADESLRKDREVVLVAVRHGGSALQYVDKMFKKDRDVVFAAVMQNARAFQYADESIRADRDIALAALKKDADMFQYVGESLRMDRNFILSVVEQNATVFKSIDGVFRKDKTICLVAIRQNPKLFLFVDDLMKKDRDVVFSAVRLYSYLFQYADVSLKKDKDFIFSIVKRNRASFRYVDDAVKKDKEFFSRLVFANIGVLDMPSKFFADLSDEKSHLIAYAWERLRDEYFDDLNRYFTFDDMKDFVSFRRALKEKYDIDFIERFHSITTLLQIIGNRISINPMDKKITILIYPKKDYNGGFAAFPSIDRMLELGYYVLYYEVSSENEAKVAMSEATLGGKNKADVLVLAGHGSVSMLDFGEERAISGKRMIDEAHYVDVSDFEGDKDDLQLANYIKRGGDLILYGCLIGKGGYLNRANLANVIAKTLPMGVRVQSAMTTTNIKKIEQSGEHIVFKFKGKNYVFDI